MSVFIVSQGDAWLSSGSLEVKGVFVTLEKAVNAIVEKGEFDNDWIDDEENNMDYVKEHLLEYRQTPQCGDTNYIIEEHELNEWEE